VETQSDAYFEKISAADNLVNEQQMKVGVAEIVEDYLKTKGMNLVRWWFHRLSDLKMLSLMNWCWAITNPNSSDSHFSNPTYRLTTRLLRKWRV